MGLKMFRGSKYANVVSTLALVVAVGGTSYAAVNLPKNSVGSAQIKNNAVTTKDVKNGSLTASDLSAKARIASGPAGGALSGAYPNPGLAHSAPGVALAGLTSPGNNTLHPQVLVWFNRLGGAPAIERYSTGVYYVTIPGLYADVSGNFVATGQSPNGRVVGVSSTSLGRLFVVVANAAGTPVDDYFSLVVYAASPSGTTSPRPATTP